MRACSLSPLCPKSSQISHPGGFQRQSTHHEVSHCKDLTSVAPLDCTLGAKKSMEENHDLKMACAAAGLQVLWTVWKNPFPPPTTPHPPAIHTLTPEQSSHCRKWELVDRAPLVYRSAYGKHIFPSCGYFHPRSLAMRTQTWHVEQYRNGIYIFPLFTLPLGSHSCPWPISRKTLRVDSADKSQGEVRGQQRLTRGIVSLAIA